jgi:hypothetical protein
VTHTKRYSDLRGLLTFEERFQYLKLGGAVGRETFGYDRIFNQRFYTSREWRSCRDQVIVRDGGLDLGIEGHEIYDKVLVHHINPVTMDDLKHGGDVILDPEFLICVSHLTHNAIHFGDESRLPEPLVERRPGDTLLWTR